MGTRGGKRLGAGRKRGIASIKAEEARKYVVERIVEELEPILAGQIEQAKGAYYETKGADGQKKVYRREPDARVAAFLLNQVIGRAKETVDMNVAPSFSLLDLHRKRQEMLDGNPDARIIAERPLLAPGSENSEVHSRLRPDAATMEAFKNKHPEYRKFLEPSS